MAQSINSFFESDTVTTKTRDDTKNRSKDNHAVSKRFGFKLIVPSSLISFLLLIMNCDFLFFFRLQKELMALMVCINSFPHHLANHFFFFF